MHRFISDEMYIKLTGKETVHTAYYPEADENLIDEKVEERMGLVKTLVNLGRGTREKEKLKVRQPLQEVIIDGSYESIISDLVPLIQEELNVKNVVFERNWINTLTSPSSQTSVKPERHWARTSRNSARSWQNAMPRS